MQNPIKLRKFSNGEEKARNFFAKPLVNMYITNRHLFFFLHIFSFMLKLVEKAKLLSMSFSCFFDPLQPLILYLIHSWILVLLTRHPMLIWSTPFRSLWQLHNSYSMITLILLIWNVNSLSRTLNYDDPSLSYFILILITWSSNITKNSTNCDQTISM